MIADECGSDWQASEAKWWDFLEKSWNNHHGENLGKSWNKDHRGEPSTANLSVIEAGGQSILERGISF